MTENQAPRAYQIRTFGCQMNVHDSERLAGQLEDAGYAVTYKEFDGPHAVPEAIAQDAFKWFTR